MTRKDDEEFDLFKAHLRGYYVKPETYNFGGSCQAFVKITGRSYSSKKVVATLDYIGQESDGVGKETCVLDENDNVVLPEEYQSAVKDWRFNETVEQRNESKKSNQHKTRLTTQFVVSFPKGTNLSAKQTEAFMIDFMQPYREKGARYFIAVHTEQGSRHAHVIIKNETDFGERLKFNRADIKALRQRQVDVAKSYHIRLENTLVKQRRELPLKQSLLERQVPNWYRKNKEIVLRDKGDTPIKFMQNPIDLERENSALNEWAEDFKDTNKAKTLFLEMYVENPRTAFWYANNRADIFGKQHRKSEHKQLNCRNFKLARTDGENIVKMRDKIIAQMGTSLSLDRVSIEQAWQKIYNLPEFKSQKKVKTNELER